ncbi:MAG TPA: 4Fe-4S dicluster domain-containing protein [Chloroflexi bacterium]|jgi:Fe-S-cluster-containing dehydrogenase component|nr:4Fe-4S dicluster domain-containing protein [Chloroflexota bacterium]
MPEDTVIAVEALCRDCQACTLACSLYHERVCSPALARLVVSKDMSTYQFRIQICRHCDDPACYAACPVDAMHMDDDGVVTISDDACIRCGACAQACPYDAIFYNEAADRYLKCDLCTGRAEGPLCVEICPVGALHLSSMMTDAKEEA